MYLFNCNYLKYLKILIIVLLKVDASIETFDIKLVPTVL